MTQPGGGNGGRAPEIPFSLNADQFYIDENNQLVVRDQQLVDDVRRALGRPRPERTDVMWEGSIKVSN